MNTMKSKKKETKDQKIKDRKKSKDEQSHDQPNETFDFGGIPERDLKKNLGCG